MTEPLTCRTCRWWRQPGLIQRPLIDGSAIGAPVSAAKVNRGVCTNGAVRIRLGIVDVNVPSDFGCVEHSEAER